eukprot:m.325282 g.325282  ORF g.325282 m.325282 type:complete len:55 (-) comp20381_c0_seq7:1762-1926(-)
MYTDNSPISSHGNARQVVFPTRGRRVALRGPPAGLRGLTLAADVAASRLAASSR